MTAQTNTILEEQLGLDEQTVATLQEIAGILSGVAGDTTLIASEDAVIAAEGGAGGAGEVLLTGIAGTLASLLTAVVGIGVVVGAAYTAKTFIVDPLKNAINNPTQTGLSPSTGSTQGNIPSAPHAGMVFETNDFGGGVNTQGDQGVTGKWVTKAQYAKDMAAAA